MRSTSIPFAAYTVDNDSDTIIVRLDAKDPQRIDIMNCVCDVLEKAQRNDEASQARAMAQKEMPQPAPRPNPAG